MDNNTDDNANGRTMLLWKNLLAGLDDSLKVTLGQSADECKEKIKLLSEQLIERLQSLENSYNPAEHGEDENKPRFIDKWRSTIQEWRKNVYELKCHRKAFLRDLLRKHCDFLMNLNQFHPEFIKWKISRLIMETKKVIAANEAVFDETESTLLKKGLIISYEKFEEDPDEKKEKDEDDNSKEHDAINVNFDEETTEKNFDQFMVEPIQEVRTDTTLSSIATWLDELKEIIDQRLPTFKNYDPLNIKLQIAIDHLENCKHTIIQMSKDFLKMVRPFAIEELMETKTKSANQMSIKDRESVERWIECLSFFEYLLGSIFTYIIHGTSIWNQHICRLETVRYLVQSRIRSLIIQQNKQQMNIEQNINILIDYIREASTEDEIETYYRQVHSYYQELLQLFSNIYEKGLSKLDYLQGGCDVARSCFYAQIALILAGSKGVHDFPSHGSELSITIDRITGLHHWEMIRQIFISFDNWQQGIIEGLDQLTIVDERNYEYQWRIALTDYLSWVKDIKEQSIYRRMERLNISIVSPRIRELKVHKDALKVHLKGVEDSLKEKICVLEHLVCELLLMIDELEQEYNSIISYKQALDTDPIQRNKLLLRIEQFENRINNIEDVKNKMINKTLERIRKKYIWLQKANFNMLQYVRLFMEGGNFRGEEALLYSNAIKKMHHNIINEFNLLKDAVINVTQNIHPLKNISRQHLKEITYMIHYKTRKDSLNEMTEFIMEKANEALKLELKTARCVFNELCQMIGNANITQQDIIDILKILVSYLRFPENESPMLECENMEYIVDFLPKQYKTTAINPESDEDFVCKPSFTSNKEERCQQLMEELGINIEDILDPRKTGKRNQKVNDGDKSGKRNQKVNDGDKSGKRNQKVNDGDKSGKRNQKVNDGDKSDKRKQKGNNVDKHGKKSVKDDGEKKGAKKSELNKREKKSDAGKESDIKKYTTFKGIELGPCGERKDVLRDTPCEQARRTKSLNELEKENIENEAIAKKEGKTGNKTQKEKKSSSEKKRKSSSEKKRKSSSEKKRKSSSEKKRKSSSEKKKKSSSEKKRKLSSEKKRKSSRDKKNKSATDMVLKSKSTSISKKQENAIISPSQEMFGKSESIDDFKMENSADEIEEPIMDESMTIGDSYLYRYTKIPLEFETSCNFLLYTKRIIYNHFIQIQKFSEKFFKPEISNKKKICAQCNPKHDFKEFTNNILRRLRILNIECEQSWILFVHDFLYIIRALQGITEESIQQNFNYIQEKCKLDMSKLCCESDVALEEAVVRKSKQTLQLINKHEIMACDHENPNVLKNDIVHHCNDHVDEIKKIWSQFTTEMNNKYTGFKSDLSNFSKESAQLRSTFIGSTSIYTFFITIKKFSHRYISTFNNYLNEYDSMVKDLNLEHEPSENVKLKSIIFLIKVMITVIEDIEANYFEKELHRTRKNYSPDSVIPEMMTIEKVDIQQQSNQFLQEIVKNIKGTHRCFKEQCTDQISVTVKWLKSWTDRKSTRVEIN